MQGGSGKRGRPRKRAYRLAAFDGRRGLFLHAAGQAGLLCVVGQGAGEGGCMLHNPRYDFNDEVLPIGAAYWCRLAETVLAQS
jgi:metal-dependent amidase/aminoacylase/carboxypeptidase family protein